MNPEDCQRLEACLLEAAEILYRNTQTSDLTSFESLEKAVRTKVLEHRFSNGETRANQAYIE